MTAFAKRKGFTLIELVVALAIASALMVALLSILRVVSLQLKASERKLDDEAIVKLVENLRRELLVTSRIASKDGWLWLEGDAAYRPGASFTAKHVGYGCVPWVGSQTVLLRKSEEQSDIAAFNVRRLMCERVDIQGVCQPLSSEFAGVPERVRLTLWGFKDESPVFVGDLVIR